MGKVFNDQIVKILCAKNLQKEPNEFVESNLSLKCPNLKRGESYVVFLDKNHRRDLQRKIVGLEQRMKSSADTALCSVHSCDPTLPVESALQPWSDMRLVKQLSSTQQADARAHFRLDLRSVMNLDKQPFHKSTSTVVARRNEDKEKILPTPAVFGPFPDESLCAFFDRLYFCICLLLGRNMEPLEAEQLNA